jgi:hypothetical protein
MSCGLKFRLLHHQQRTFSNLTQRVGVGVLVVSKLFFRPTREGRRECEADDCGVVHRAGSMKP